MLLALIADYYILKLAILNIWFSSLLQRAHLARCGRMYIYSCSEIQRYSGMTRVEVLAAVDEFCSRSVSDFNQLLCVFTRAVNGSC